jgi:hypothetical protein
MKERIMAATNSRIRMKDHRQLRMLNGSTSFLQHRSAIVGFKNVSLACESMGAF